MTWEQLLQKLLSLGKTPQEIKEAILLSVPEGELSQEEADARVQQLDQYVEEMKGTTTIAETESGSLYEFDLASQSVRRLQGKDNPTPRVGKDGDWRKYEAISPLMVGEPILISWPATTPLLPGSDGGVPATITSRIVAIHREGKVLS